MPTPEIMINAAELRRLLYEFISQSAVYGELSTEAISAFKDYSAYWERLKNGCSSRRLNKILRLAGLRK